MEALLTVEELSDRLKVGKSTLYKWVHEEYIPHLKLRGSIRFNEAAVSKWLSRLENNGRKSRVPEFGPEF